MNIQGKDYVTSPDIANRPEEKINDLLSCGNAFYCDQHKSCLFCRVTGVHCAYQYWCMQIAGIKNTESATTCIHYIKKEEQHHGQNP